MLLNLIIGSGPHKNQQKNENSIICIIVFRKNFSSKLSTRDYVGNDNHYANFSAIGSVGLLPK